MHTGVSASINRHRWKVGNFSVVYFHLKTWNRGGLRKDAKCPEVPLSTVQVLTPVTHIFY
jgi:hypothetical protein